MAASVEDQHANTAPSADDQEPSSAEKAQMELRKRIMKIMMDPTLTDAEKAQRRQDLMSGKWSEDQEEKPAAAGGKKEEAKKPADSSKGNSKKSDLLEDTLKCVICFNLCERPVTGPCQHNFCLACFKRWLGQGKKTCPTCRAGFPAKFCENPRINTLLTYAIRCAKQGIRNDAPKAYNRIADESRPAEAFTTERAVRNGRANAASGRIMVNVPNDHFGPILPEHDPVNGKGVQVGDWWKDRLDCRQWGAHFPHVAGIAGQSTRGAQSVVLSGGYEDDHDEGEWFLYTGSGGRDLSGNKRTNKTQSFDQTFDNMNAALKVSCLRGLPVRVVRSFKEKRSSYAPSVETPVRYDGIYRILRCWRKKGAQGFLMCRYLFVRCDNSPAPWTSDETGDTKRLDIPELAAKEIKAAQGQVFAMSDKPFWDFDDAKGEWVWARDAPPSQKAPGGGDAVKKLKKKASAHERLLRDFSCSLCKGVLQQPLSMPCGHNFCKGCLDKRFAEAEAAQHQGSKALAEAQPARSLRVRKVPKPCPTCKADLADCLNHAAVNTEMAELIRRLQEAGEEARRAAEQEAAEAAEAAGDGAGSSRAAAAAAAAGAGEGSDGEEEEQEEEEGSEGDEEEGQEEQGAGPSSSRQQPPQKRQRVAAAAAAADADTQQQEDKQEAPADAPAAAAAAGPSHQQQQPAAAAAAAAPAAAGGAGRYASEVAQLTEAFPDFDAELVAGLLEDQGGDVEEVHAYLKRMKRQLAAANRPPKPAAAAGSSKAKGKKGKGRGKKGAAAAAAQAEDGAEDAAGEGEEEKEGAEGGEAGGVETAATAAAPAAGAAAQAGAEAGADTEMADGAEDEGEGAAAAADAAAAAEEASAEGSDGSDTQPGSDRDTGRKQQGKGRGRATAAAAAGGVAAGSKGGRKRGGAAAAQGAPAAKKRCAK